MLPICIAGKALTQLGFTPVALNALYKIAIRIGYFSFISQPPKPQPEISIRFFQLPTKQDLTCILGNESAEIISEADEIIEGKVRNYRSISVALKLDYPHGNHHWSDFETGRARIPLNDIKDIWEPARFGWGLVLARAYMLTADEKYARAFWDYFMLFSEANPPYIGMNWMSGQEVAFRLICLVFCWQIFRLSPSIPPDAHQIVVKSIEAHAHRIPPTLLYARSQQNNHLLSEAAGLYCAGVFLSDHPQAKNWKLLGKKYFYKGILEQINADGEYAQHSSNYHRLMLQLALWMDFCHRIDNDNFPDEIFQKLTLATTWLIDRVHLENGKIQNLGHHDGADFLLLALDDLHGYKSVIQAASRAFINQDIFPQGPWDEMSIWLGLIPFKRKMNFYRPQLAREEIALGSTRCFLRAIKYTNRPAHADQLHTEIWHRDENIACDCGTYRYTDAPGSPWQNAMADSMHHNTLRLNNAEPMLRAGRFLWLDFDQAAILEKTSTSIHAQRDGYRPRGFIHQRILQCLSEKRVRISDLVYPVQSNSNNAEVELFWHLPAEDCSVANPFQFTFSFKKIKATLSIVTSDFADVSQNLNWQIIRVGVPIFGNQTPQPLLGFHSPTYSLLQPCFSLRVWGKFNLPYKLDTIFEFTDKT